MVYRLTESDLRDAISNIVNKLIDEVRYIDVSPVRGRGAEKSLQMGWDDVDEFRTKVVNDIRNYYRWNVVDMTDKTGGNDHVILYVEPVNSDSSDPESLSNYLRSTYKFKYPMSIQPKGNGLYVSFYFKKDSNYNPIGKNEKIRVFHGTDIKTAIKIAKNGLSGKERASRTYSYEYGMNPNGLFVTTDFYTAKEFGYHYDDQVILEFTVNSNDLDTPVWNGQGTYFGQFSNPQPFSSRNDRVVQKMDYQRNAEMSEFPFISQSDNPAMAERIYNNNEHQALFYGDLNPNQVKRFWYKKKGTNEYVPLSFRQFMKMFSDYSYTSVEYGNKSTRTINREKVFMPNEDWMGPEDFVRHCKKLELALGRTWDENYTQYMFELAKKWEDVGFGDGELDLWSQQQMSQLLYPKQIIGILGIDKYREYFDRYYPEFRMPGHRV